MQIDKKKLKKKIITYDSYNYCNGKEYCMYNNKKKLYIPFDILDSEVLQFIFAGDWKFEELYRGKFSELMRSLWEETDVTLFEEFISWRWVMILATNKYKCS